MQKVGPKEVNEMKVKDRMKGNLAKNEKRRKNEGKRRDEGTLAGCPLSNLYLFLHS
jgi:hypothetical protein